MTYLLPPGRALSQHLVSRASRAAAQKSCANSWSRVAVKNPRCLSSLARSNTLIPILSQLLSRTYATGTGKPKAHTGRPAASKRKPAVVTSDAAAGTPKKAAAKKKPARKPKRAVKKKAKTKPKSRKAKAKPKKKRAPKELTEEQQARKAKRLAAKASRELAEKKKTLKETAQLNPPKQLPYTAFTVLVKETASKGVVGKDIVRASSTQYKSLRPEEMERLNHIANENKAKNNRAYASWLTNFTPSQIRDANQARIQLRRLTVKDGRPIKVSSLQDERQVKQSRSAYNYFNKERFDSGDFKNMKLSEIGPLVSREWKALTESERKPFNDRATADKARYREEYRNVYGQEPRTVQVQANKTRVAAQKAQKAQTKAS